MVPNAKERALRDNLITYDVWLELLKTAAVSSIGWRLPPTVDVMYLERELFYHTKAIAFIADDALVALSGFGTSKPNLYGIPLRRTVNAKNGFTAELDNTNSVIIYDNMTHNSGSAFAARYALRLATLDRIIDLNTNAQKTPYIIRSSKETELSVKNAFGAIDSGDEYIAVTDDFREQAIQVLKLDVPFTAPQIRSLQRDILNEYLTYIGIGSANTDKPERLITSEVAASNSGLMIYRNARLKPRQIACDEINRRFARYLDEPAQVFFNEDILTNVLNKETKQEPQEEQPAPQEGGENVE